MSSKPEPLELEKDTGYCKFGGEILSKLLEAFENQIEGVIKKEDSEFIHRMRVASRRIRAAMPLFKRCFPKKKFKRWLKQVKQVTLLLGEARDLDVQMTFIRQYESRNEEYTKNPIMDLLLKNYEARRARIQPTIVRALQKLQASGVLAEMRESCDRIAEDLQKPYVITSSMLERAYWNISYRLDDLLAMERYVHEENEILRHHEMRIKAKWLRYTMETFSQLYANKLTEEIETVKSFQDLLGEMHDCDVLAGYTARFMSKTRRKTKLKTLNKRKNDIEQPLLRFLEYVKEQRKILYVNFVDLWENSKKKRFFKRLGETTKRGFSKPEDKIEELRAKHEAKVAVLADVHGNLHALQAVIEDAEKRGIRSFLNAGDLVGFGPFPNEVIEVLQSRNVISVIGNFDLEVVQKIKKGSKEKKIALEFAEKQVSGTSRTYLLSLPRSIKLEIVSKRLLVVHGSPKSIDEHLYSDTPVERLKELAQEAKADVIITGHSHEQYIRELSGVFFLNPGSVGRPGDDNPQAAYAVVMFNPLSFELIRVNYDVTAAADALRKEGLPESFPQMLLRGVAIEEIAREDREGEDTRATNCQEKTKCCEEISKQYWPDIGHYEQVRKLSLRLFDELQSIHKLSNTERCWLECATILHDIGLSQATKAHNKKSMELILNDTRLILASDERRIIASIARYHRKNFPNKRHFNLASLSPNTIQTITLLSGIIRLADSLDYTHNDIVENLRLRIGFKKIAVECTSTSNPEPEQQAFIKKKDLLEKALRKKMVLIWKQL